MSKLHFCTSDESDNFRLERELHSRGYRCVAGVDEVGRGPLAGPVVAACVSLPASCDPSIFHDSKGLTARQRIDLARILTGYGAPVGIGIVSHRRIDQINILQASLLAMKLAVHHHSLVYSTPDFLLVDGKFEIPLDTPQIPLVKGEKKSGSIAAASIVAKITRDAIMERLHERFPQFHFLKNKGYPTGEHRKVLAVSGPCCIHRRSFRGVKEFVI